MNETRDINNIIENFYNYFCRILKLYQDAVIILRDELKHIQTDDINALNSSLRMQQALFLETNGFNKKVAEYMIKLDISANTMTEAIQQLPESEQLRFYSLLAQFNITLKQIIFYKEKCHTILQTKLYTLEKVLSQHNLQNNTTTYNQDASEIRGTLFPKSFETTI